MAGRGCWRGAGAATATALWMVCTLLLEIVHFAFIFPQLKRLKSLQRGAAAPVGVRLSRAYNSRQQHAASLQTRRHTRLPRSCGRGTYEPTEGTLPLDSRPHVRRSLWGHR